MLDRQDIDALLIGRLYGELTDADEARLNAHLDSHPADKSALAGLTSARNAVRESRFLTVQLEPPQAISAVLLQEASRRAPAKVAPQDDKKKESWFARFVASFARHPAMAAAAMLVLVAGVAGTMYLKDGKSRFADQSTQTFSANEKAATEAPAPAAAAPAIEMDRGTLEEAKALQKQAGSSFEASLSDGQDFKGKQDSAEVANVNREPTKEVAAKTEPAPKAANRTYIGVPSERAPQPKDLEIASAADGDGADDARQRKGAAAPGAAEQRRDPVVATPSPPPPPATRAPATAPRGAGAGGEDAPRQEQKPTDEETSWAREQAVKVANAVKANNCKDAASLAVQLSTRNPAFYKDNVENDRDLKKCITYINAAREKDAEQQRLKNLKRNAEEANPRRAAPTTNTK